jgi:hypothetical protein
MSLEALLIWGVQDRFASRRSFIFNTLERLFTQDKKIPVPEISKEKQKELTELYQKELIAKTPEAIDKLFQDAVKTTGIAPDDIATRYALLEMARQMALTNYLFKDAFNITDEMTKTYDVNDIGIKAASFEEARKKKKTPEQTESVTQAGIDVAIAAVNKGLESKNKSFYDFAIKTAKSAQTDAKSLKNITLTNMAEIVEKYATDLNGNGATGELATNKWKYFILNDAKALDALSNQTTDTKLKRFAGLMSFEKKAPGQYYELGDVAYEAAIEKSRPGYEQRVLLEKALENYQSVVSTATGAEKTKYERDQKLKKRVEEIEKKMLANTNLVNLLSMIDPGVDKVSGDWTLSNSKLALTKRTTGIIRIPYSPPTEYDISITVEPKEGDETVLIGLVKDSAKFFAGIDVQSPAAQTGFQKIDGRSTHESTYNGELLKTNKESTITCSVRNDGVTIIVDGKKISEFKGPYSRLSYGGTYAPPNHPGLYITAIDTAAVFSKIHLTPVSGQGKKTR